MGTVVAFATARSAGRVLDGHTVRALDDEADLGGFDIALFSAGSGTSREWAPRFVQDGAIVIDNSSCSRDGPGVSARRRRGQPRGDRDTRGSSPTRTAPPCRRLVVLKPIHDAVGLERIVFTSYQSTSGTGARAIQELKDQATAILQGGTPPAPSIYPHQIAFNVLPQVETFKDGDDYTTEERKVVAESRKILGLPELRITVTCARVPVLNCHSEALNVETRGDLGPDRVPCAAFAGSRGDRRRRPRCGPLSDGIGGIGSRRGVRGADPPGRIESAHAESVGGRRQPAQGCRHQRGSDRRAARGHRGRVAERLTTKPGSRERDNG